MFKQLHVKATTTIYPKTRFAEKRGPHPDQGERRAGRRQSRPRLSLRKIAD
jgi:hypothetical protein